MNRFARWGLAACLLPLAACSSQQPAQPVAETPPSPTVPLADQSFATMAAQDNMAEVQFAELAQTKARSPRVKAFASQMISAHTPATDNLLKVMQSKNLAPPTSLSDMQQQQKEMLQADTGARFDRAYMRGQVADHEAMLKALQDEVQNGQDADLKQYAQTTIPVVEKHLAEARRAAGIRAQMSERHGTAKPSTSAASM